VAPTCTPKKEPTTVPTRLVVAPMTVATLVTSFYLRMEAAVIKAISKKPMRMIQNPYFILM
jgi:hypothetical protein